MVYQDPFSGAVAREHMWHPELEKPERPVFHSKDRGEVFWSVGLRALHIVPYIYIYFGAFFSLAFIFFGLLFFIWGQCSNNDDHHTSIYLQLMSYNSKLEQDMTLYEYLRRCTGMGNESGVTCMKNYEWWPCHKYEIGRAHV